MVTGFVADYASELEVQKAVVTVPDQVSLRPVEM